MAVTDHGFLVVRPPLRRRMADHVATAAMVGAALVALLVLLLVVGYLVQRGAGAISWEFLTADIPRNSRAVGGGVWPAVVGTGVITGAAAGLAIPLGVLGAVHLHELGRHGRLARLIRFVADVMTGVPSVVMGLFVYTVWVVPFEAQSGLAASLALACLMLPIVLRTTEEALGLVPDELRMASQALGARTWRTTLTVVLPAALSGIVSGSMLAIARAAGETAPVVFVAGIAFEANWSLSGQNVALPVLIFRNASQPFPGAQERAWGAALTLVAIVFACTLLARLVSRRFGTGPR